MLAAAVGRRTLVPALIVAALLYLAFWPVPADPVAWSPPPAPPLSGPYAPNDRLARVERLPVGGRGPEDVAIGPDGRIYAGLADGRLMRLSPQGNRPELFASTGGRPLGLRFDPEGRLVVADAVRGLLRVAPDGTVEVLATEAGGVRFGLTDDLDVARDGTVYFTDASSRFAVGDSITDIVEHRCRGRLLAYDPSSRTTRLLLDGLCFANGVALAPDESYVLVAESASYRVRRYWLAGDRRGATDVYVDDLPGFPDGVSSNGHGTFWLALVSPRNPLLDRLHPYPALKRVLLRLPSFVRPGPRRYGFVLGLDAEGRVVHNLQDPTGRSFALVTNVVESGGALYLGTIGLDAIGRLPWPSPAGGPGRHIALRLPARGGEAGPGVAAPHRDRTPGRRPALVKDSLHAPHLLDVEVAQVLRRYAAAGELSPDRGREALADLVDLPVQRYPHDVLLPRIWELRQNVTAYDAAYLALAEALRAPLMTCDARLGNAPGHHVKVEVL